MFGATSYQSSAGVILSMPARALGLVLGALVLGFCLSLTTPARADYADGLRAFESGDYSRAISLWRRSGWQDDDMFSQFKLGELYRDGEYVPQDDVESYVWFFLAAINASRIGVTLAATVAGLDTKKVALLERTKLVTPMVPSDRIEAERRIVYILASRGATGFFQLGEIYDATRGDDRLEAVLSNFTPEQKREAQGVLTAIRNYVRGAPATPASGPESSRAPSADRDPGPQRNNAEALAYYIRSAERGHPVAVTLEAHLRNVLASQPDVIASAERRAAEWEPPFEHYPGGFSDESRGDSDRGVALDRVGELRLEFIQHALAALGYYTVKIDNAYGPSTREAIKKFQWSVGERSTGELTPAQTVALIKTAAVKGHAISQNTLGTMYFKGIGVPLDYVRARNWFERAADQRYAFALYNLGQLYRDGLGVPADKNQAATYFMAAQFAGYGSVDTELRDLGWN